MYLSAGHGEGVGDKGDGGSISISAGNSMHANGGHVVLQSGFSEQLTSGSIGKHTYAHMPCLLHTSYHHFFYLHTLVIDTANAGQEGDSGFMRLTTGNSDSSNSGSILISTGNAVDEQTIFPNTPTYKGGDSGNINITTGLAVKQGGNISMVAGGATGQIIRSKYDRRDQKGGDIYIASGHSIEASSGKVTVESTAAGKQGDSGTVTLSSGDANTGNAGMIAILSGTSHELGKGGNIEVLAGTSSGNQVDGSTVYLHGGTM